MLGHGARGLAQGRPPPRGGVEPQRGRPGGSAAPGGGHRPPRGRRRAPGLRLLPWARPASPRMSRVTARKKLASLSLGASTGPPGLCDVRAELRVQRFGQSRPREARFEGRPWLPLLLRDHSRRFSRSRDDHACLGRWLDRQREGQGKASLPCRRAQPASEAPGPARLGGHAGTRAREAPAGPPAPRTRPHLTGSSLPPASRPPPPRPRARCCPRPPPGPAPAPAARPRAQQHLLAARLCPAPAPQHFSFFKIQRRCSLLPLLCCQPAPFLPRCLGAAPDPEPHVTDRSQRHGTLERREAPAARAPWAPPSVPPRQLWELQADTCQRLQARCPAPGVRSSDRGPGDGGRRGDATPDDVTLTPEPGRAAQSRVPGGQACGPPRPRPGRAAPHAGCRLAVLLTCGPRDPRTGREHLLPATASWR